MTIKQEAIAILAIILLGGGWLAANYGLTSGVDFSSPEKVATAYLQAYTAAREAGFFNREDKRAYDLLTPETQAQVDSQIGPLYTRLVNLANGLTPPADLTVKKMTVSGDQAKVDFNGVTIYLLKSGPAWQVYSVVRN